MGAPGASDALCWSVELPERSSSGFGAPSGKGKLLLFGPEGDESWTVPRTVAKKLAARLDDDPGFAPSRAELAYEVKECSLSCGMQRIERLVNKRDYSSSELDRKLALDGYSQAVRAELIARAERSGLIDDARFASVFARSKVYAGWGRIKVERELTRRGIRPEDVEGWPDEFFCEQDELERAKELASRRRLTGKNDFQKIVRFLCGKGYAMNIAIDAAKSVLDR